MAKKEKTEKTHRSILGPLTFLFAIVLVIILVFVGDEVARLFWKPKEDKILETGDFYGSTKSDSENVESVEGLIESGEVGDDDAETETGEIVTLGVVDMLVGTLINVDAGHTYSGAVALGDFTGCTDETVKVRSDSLSIRVDILDDIASLFDAYAAYNGTNNLQIYSTLQSTLPDGGIYTNQLPDRATGLGFDIGLITSTGDVVPYIQKHNEWMVENSWAYGFILRYPSDKVDVTGVEYAPHHFRYVGQPHAAIMHEKNYCLEEYLDYLQAYSQDTPLYYTYSGVAYTIYYVTADVSGTTYVSIPDGDDYTISGDNSGGYVVTLWEKPEETAAQSEAAEMTETTTEAQ